MSDYESYLQKALRSLHVAEYMLTNTYPSVREPKLLLAIIDDLHISHINLIHAILKKEKKDTSDDFIHTFSEFKSISKKYEFTDEDFDLIFKIKRILDEHKESKVEFARKDKFIICLDNYKMESIGVEDVKEYIFKSKHLLRRLPLK